MCAIATMKHLVMVGSHRSVHMDSNLWCQDAVHEVEGAGVS